MAGPNFPFYDLTDAQDIVFLGQLPPDLLTNFPAGVRALGGDDQVIGTVTTDFVFGNLGNDTLYGFGGEDILWGGQGSDVLLGFDGNDNLNGNLGDDVVDGGAGNDLVRGGQGNDFLAGAEGNDTLVGDLGQDTVSGGAGNDLFVLRRDAAAAPDPTTGAIGADLLLDVTVADDRLGLTGGLTVNDLQLIPIQLNVGGQVRESTAINFVENGQLRSLGVVAGLVPSQVAAIAIPIQF